MPDSKTPHPAPPGMRGDSHSSPQLSPETYAIRAGRGEEQPGAPLNPPIVLASTFRQGGERVYSREDGTPVWDAFEEVLGGLEGGWALAFGSGMAAATAVLECLPVGATVVAPLDGYSGVLAQLRESAESGRLQVRFADLVDTAGTERMLPGADLLWLESPSNPMMEVLELQTLCEAARRVGALSVVDNTFATPARQQPLKLGADLVIHSVTKFLGGHSDLLMGAVAGRDPELRERVHGRRSLGGAAPGALESFLALRGLRTLHVRLDRAEANAAELAGRLEQHAGVSRVRYPGLASDPGHSRARAQMQGFGAVLSFELHGDAASAEDFAEALQLIHPATSLGGVESTLERRARYGDQEHVPPTLIRMSVGCESLQDLWRDLEQALDRTAARRPRVSADSA